MNHELHEEGRRRAVIRFVERKYTQQFNQWASQDKFHKICSDESFVKMCQKLKAYEDNLGYWLITVNPPESPDMQYKSLLRLAEKIRSYKNFLGDFHYVIEQRSEDGSFHGQHMHIHAKDIGCKKFDIIKRIHSAATSGINPIIRDLTRESIDVKHCTKDKLEYLKGDKGKEKELRVHNDFMFRTKYNLEPIYFQPRFSADL